MPERKRMVILLVFLLVAAAAIVVVTLPGLNRVTTRSSSSGLLPPGCVRPQGGFLIIASELGYNESVDHLTSQNVSYVSWPVLQAHEGQNVTIVVCNADPSQAHGFQIDEYYQAGTVAIAPGQVLRVSFIADKSGTFRIYCNIFCTVHWAMQNGELVVS